MLGSTRVGSGSEQVVMLHDWFCDHTSYDLFRLFCDQEKFTFHFLDLRGYGLSKELGGPYDLNQAYQDVSAYLKATFSTPIHLVGHSMSTLIVQKFLEKDSFLLKSATLVGPVPAFGMEAPDDILGFMKSIAVSNNEGACQVIGMMTGDRLHGAWASFKVKKWYETSIEAARLGYLEMFITADFAELLKEKGDQTIPLLLVTGKYDAEGHQIAAMETSLLRWFPKAQLIEIENSGHYPMQETAPYFVSVLDQFHRGLE